VHDALVSLRDKHTTPEHFRRAATRISVLLAAQALSDVPALDVTVETATVDTQDGERDQVLKSPDFFWVEKHPQAVFHSAHFERVGTGWRATGELTIRGVKKTVPVSFTLMPAGAATAMKGSVSLKRLAFGLGQGDWASTEWVGDDVEVRFNLKLAPVG